MDETADFFADEDAPRARLALLLEHFSHLADDREPWRIVYPLSEILLLLTCGTIASCDNRLKYSSAVKGRVNPALSGRHGND